MKFLFCREGFFILFLSLVSFALYCVFQFITDRRVGTGFKRIRFPVRNETLLIKNELASELVSSYKSDYKSSNRSTSWTILLTVNNAFFDFYQNWLWHYQQLHLPADNPVIVVAEDNKSYEELKALKTPGFRVKKSLMEPINSSLVYDTPLFKKYMARRAAYVLECLEQENDVLHADADSVWLHNPLPYLVGDFDIWGQVESPSNDICIGFVAFKVNETVKKFVKLWVDTMKSTDNKQADQDVFNDLLRKTIDLKINRLPVHQFPSGKLYFDKFDNVTRVNATVVHNNFIIGHNKKRDRFKKFNLWKV